MGKDGFLTPKAIANRIKSKGLQKLRWYCQMCQKQCRDENGFKCHTMSESHQRQLLLFAENPHNFLGTFSKEFKDGYLDLLKRRFGTKRVKANNVYQEYINDKNHVHMNATRWETLTQFVKWLGRESLAVVDETEKGWFVQYIDRDPETLRRAEAAKNKEKMEKDDEERLAAFIKTQVEKAKETSKDANETKPTELHRSNEEEKVVLKMDDAIKPGPATSKSLHDNPLARTSSDVSMKKKESNGKRKSALDEIIEIEEKKKQKIAKKDYWLFPDIVVKIITKKLGDKYYKKKAVVKEVKDKFTAIVKLIDSGDKLKLDQTHLETVIPAIGKRVLILNGAYRGDEATMFQLNEKTFSCIVKIAAGPLNGKLVEALPYEDLCKIHTE